MPAEIRRNLVFYLGMTFFLLINAIVLALAFSGGDPKPAPVSQPNYEAMADCLAEQHYVTQYQMTLRQYTKAIRLCDTFTRHPQP